MTIHGNPSFDLYASNATLPLTVRSILPLGFHDIFEARNFSDNEFSNIFRFHRRTENPEFVHYHHPFPDPLSLQAICHSHLYGLQQWHRAFQQATLNPSGGRDEKQSIALFQLEIQHLLATNTLHTLFTTLEMIYDNILADFERILSLAESLILSTKNEFYIFAFDTVSLLPLFCLALKYLDLGLRRKAIDLLKQAPSREGMWERESIIELAE